MFAGRNALRTAQALKLRTSATNPPSILQNPTGIRQSRFFGSTPRQSQRFRPNSYTYSRFQNTSNIFKRWSQRPTFYLEVGGLAAGAGGFYVYNIETVPVSGRRRFNIFGPEWDKSFAASQKQAVLQEYAGKVLPDWDPRTQQVKRVLDRLIPVCGLSDLDWEVYVIDDKTINAFVVPGGKVFVFTGIMPVAQDDDGMAAILGHEISHTVARHTAEKLSRSAFIVAGAIISDFLLGTGAMGQFVLNIVLDLPNGRAQESEADYMGLLLMAQACYDPQGAVRFWERMTKAGTTPPELLSTHPDPLHRMAKMKEWMSEAETKREASNCAATLGYAKQFREAMPQVRW